MTTDDGHGLYYPCPFVRCNWWARAETVLDGRAALVKHVRDDHAQDKADLEDRIRGT